MTGTKFYVSPVIIAPLIAALLATVGNGLYTTLSSLQIASLTDDAWLMGISLSIYFFGLTLGAIATQFIIKEIGHKQSYYLLCLLTVIGTLLQAMTLSLWWWLPIRLALGFALGGMFVFFETWINQHSPKARRPYYLSCYFATYYIALALGQLFLQLPMAHVTLLYVLVAALSGASVLPFVVFRTFCHPGRVSAYACHPGQASEAGAEPGSPRNHSSAAEQISIIKFKEIQSLPLLGLLGSLVSGILSGVVISLMPYFLTLRHVSQDVLSWLMLMTMLSGVLPQLFIARLAKKFRAPTLLAACSMLIVFSVIAELMPNHELYWVIVASPVIGACVFSLYPISVNMVVDAVPVSKITSANSMTLFAYSLGCCLGPLLCSLWMGQSGDAGYLYFMLLFCLGLSGVSLRRVEVRENPP